MVNYVVKLKILFAYEINFENELDLDLDLRIFTVYDPQPVSAPRTPA
jgi:hypothetical protein